MFKNPHMRSMVKDFYKLKVVPQYNLMPMLPTAYIEVQSTSALSWLVSRPFSAPHFTIMALRFVELIRNTGCLLHICAKMYKSTVCLCKLLLKLLDVALVLF